MSLAPDDLVTPAAAFSGQRCNPRIFYGDITFMATTTIEVETAAGSHRHARLGRWVEEVAQMCKPDRIHWCDGSPEEYRAMLRLLVLTGTAIPLDE
ncbi:MAG: hypothetical protein WBE23_05255, partial [Candidatus Sulfotelmatobacter sp.]